MRSFKMKRKLIPLVILTILVFTTLASLPVLATHHEKPIVVANLKGALEPDIQLEALMNLTWIEWRVVLEDITAEDLNGASLLIMSLSELSQVYSGEELSIISSWFSTGGKTIYVSGDSDYGQDYMRQAQANAVLEEIGSKLRIDHIGAEDASSNGGAPYRVLGVSTNAAPQIEFLVRGVTHGLFHAPGVVVGYEDGNYVDLSTENIDDVYVVMTTSETGILVDNSEPAPNVMVAGSEGEFPLMVIELDYAKGNTIIAAGESPYDQYMGLYKPEIIRSDRYGPNANPQQGQYLVENILKYATTFGPTMLDQAVDIMDKEARIVGIGDEIAALNGVVSTLESDISTLGSEKVGLEADIEAAQMTASTMQLAAVAALVIGVVVGYFVVPMIKKQ
jgi:hypothetical protein